PIVDSIIERAPTTSWVTFSGYRQPCEYADLAEFFRTRTGCTVPRVSFNAEKRDFSFIDLFFASSDFRGTNSNRDLERCFVLCEILLGEELLQNWIYSDSRKLS